MAHKSPPRPYVLTETNWKSVQETTFQLAILPWGATEAHNYHLPYGTDNYQVDHVAISAAEKAWNQDTKVLVLPNIPYGINTGQLDIPLCMNLLPSTQLAILKDITDVLHRHQINKLVILNGHGGNNFKTMIRELSFHFPEVFVCWVNWYQVVDWQAYFDEPGDHAGEMETSAMMAIRNDLVLSLDQAGLGDSKTFKLKAFKEGWATAQRKWSAISKDTGVGNPTRATKEKGVKYLRDCVNGLAGFFEELGKTTIDDLYE
jgi:creatinine amidohydrolase